MDELKELEKDLQKVKKEYLDAQSALFDAGVELEELLTALEILVEDYDTSFELNYIDLKDYAKGNKYNEVGEKSYDFLYDYKRIMWLARTALTYCKSAKEICEKESL